MKRLRRLAAAAALLFLAGCAPMVQPMGDQRQAPRLSSDAVEVRDGSRLPLRVWRSAGEPLAVAVAVHGFNDYAKAWEKPGRWWAERGVTLYAYDQRGFGDTRHRGVWPGRDALTGDLHDVIGAVREQHPDVPLYVIGESMGAAVAMAALARDDAPEVDAMVLSAPAVWGRETMSPLYSAALWVAAHTMPWNRLTGRGLKRRASDNIEMLRGLGADPMVIKATRVDAVYGLVNMMDAGLSAAPRLDIPLLVMYGARDEILPRDPIDVMLKRLRAPHRVVIYPDGWHMLFRDLQGQVVWRDVLTWMADRTAPLPSGHERAATPVMAGG